MKRWLPTLLLTLTSAAVAVAGNPPLAQPLDAVPLLPLKLIAPAGVSVSAWQGNTSTPLALPASVSVRPGYRYVLQLDHLPDLPGVTLFPSIEVYGLVMLPPPLDVNKHPIPVHFTTDDFRRAAAGGMVSKVIYLEDPLKASPATTTPDEPLTVDMTSEEAAWTDARRLGRPMLIVRIGERQLSEAELAVMNVPGTIALPGMTALPLPAAPPCFGWQRLPFHDPRLGPKLFVEECLADGGDIGTPIGIGLDGKAAGIDPSDTAIEYTTARGNRRVCVSNRVCLCVPRFVVLRAEAQPVAHMVPVPTNGEIGTQTGGGHNLHLPVQATRMTLEARLAQGGVRPRGYLGIINLAGVEMTQGVSLLGSVAGIKLTGTVVEPEQITAFPNCKLMLTKWIEPREAQIGETVTVNLRYVNKSPESINDITISDSLTARLDYVPNSQKGDRPATFTTQVNEAGSLVLRWELADKLLPGETGLITFQVKVK